MCRRAAFNGLMMYMSTQKLELQRAWGLSNQAGVNDHGHILRLMMKLRQLYCAI